MSNLSIDISAFQQRLPINEKNNYEWKIISVPKNIYNEDKYKPVVFSGINKNNKDDCIFIKQMVISEEVEKEDLKCFLKEVYFTISLKTQEFFPNDVNILLSKDENYLFIVFRGNNVDLKKTINFKRIDYLNNKNLVKWIIYQITFGLYILHHNNIIHHDIKPSNILISDNAHISICDFGSAIFRHEESISFTLYYASPDFLINKSNIDYRVDNKYDMWALGVIILELLSKKDGIFKKDHYESENRKEKEKEQINFIFSKFGCSNYQNLSDENLKNLKIDENFLSVANDKNAIDLLKNLLVLDPNKRFTAKQVLHSAYLEELEDEDSFDLKPIENSFNYKEISTNIINHNKFIELVKKFK